MNLSIYCWRIVGFCVIWFTKYTSIIITHNKCWVLWWICRSSSYDITRPFPAITLGYYSMSVYLYRTIISNECIKRTPVSIIWIYSYVLIRWYVIIYIMRFVRITWWKCLHIILIDGWHNTKCRYYYRQ